MEVIKNPGTPAILARDRAQRDARTFLAESRKYIDQALLMLSKNRDLEAIEYLDQGLERITWAVPKIKEGWDFP